MTICIFDAREAGGAEWFPDRAYGHGAVRRIMFWPGEALEQTSGPNTNDRKAIKMDPEKIIRFQWGKQGGLC